MGPQSLFWESLAAWTGEISKTGWKNGKMEELVEGKIRLVRDGKRPVLSADGTARA